MLSAGPQGESPPSRWCWAAWPGLACVLLAFIAAACAVPSLSTPRPDLSPGQRAGWPGEKVPQANLRQLQTVGISTPQPDVPRATFPRSSWPSMATSLAPGQLARWASNGAARILRRRRMQQTVGLVAKLERLVNAAVIAAEAAEREKEAARARGDEAAGTVQQLFPALSAPPSTLPNVNSLAQGPEPLQKLVWAPKRDRFLLLLCYRGQISNLLRCMRRHVIAAGLTNRTLIAPRYSNYQKGSYQKQFNYDLNLVWDIKHMRKCLGHNAVITLDEFKQKYGGIPEVNMVKCWYGPLKWCPSGDVIVGPSCPLDVVRAPDKSRTNRTVRSDVFDILGFNTTGLETVKTGTACMPRRASWAEFARAYAHEDDRVLAMGDLVTAVLEATAISALFESFPGLLTDNMHVQGNSTSDFDTGFAEVLWGGDHPFRRREGCPNGLAVSPHPELVRVAEQLARELFGGQRYASTHWRRGDQVRYCLMSSDWRGQCTYGPAQAAKCIKETLLKAGITNLFLASNANETEIDQLSALLHNLPGPPVRVKRLPPFWHLGNVTTFFDQDYIQEHERLLTLTLDKLICAKSNLFLRSLESTFSEDIQRLRYGFGWSTPNDGFICHWDWEWHPAQSTRFMERFNVRE